MFSFFEKHGPTKGILREKYHAERKLAQSARPDAAIHAARIFMTHIPLTDDAVIALYHPVQSELDTLPLAEALIDRALRLALPVVTKPKNPLIFREWTQETILESGRYNIEVPTLESPKIIPTHILVPLLAFSSNGHRLGYGGGYYDRTLAHLRKAHDIVAIGYGFGAQHIDHLPVSKLDEPLDWMITERGAMSFRTSRTESS